MSLQFGGKIPPCPDPDTYIWVTTKEGSYWRRKRGTNKQAVLNKKYQLSSNYMKISGPAASHLVAVIRPYLQGLLPGRLTARLSGKLRKALNETGTLHYDYLKGLDLQPEHPINKLLPEPMKVERNGNMLTISILIHEATVKRYSRLVTDYYFELILMQGDAMSLPSLDITVVESRLFPISSRNEKPCRLEMPVPDKNWIALLKVSCLEGKELAAASRNYGMKVVEVG